MPDPKDSNNLLTLPPLSLYVHIPWCVKKCPYCDFNSHSTQNQPFPEQEYLQALERDIQQSAHQAQGRKIESIFFGGGTPSLFKPQSIEAIIEMAEHQIGLTPECEITLEANPGTFEQEKFTGFRQAGVNRLSIGIQSFEQEKLQALGRIHNSEEALKAVSIARKAGFDNINLDLMFGLPKQSNKQAIADLEQAIALSPQHISWYELTIEPNTEFYSKPPVQPQPDTLADISEEGITKLAEHGYQRYETSAFCQEGKESQHNLNYWRFGDYIGVGAGAHGKYTEIKKQQIWRQSKTRLPTHYIDRIGSYVANEQIVAQDDILVEYMMNAMRLIRGVSLSEASARTGISSKDILSASEKNIKTTLIEKHNSTIAPTEQGQRLLNLCIQNFL